MRDLLARLPAVLLPVLFDAAQTAFERLVRTVAARRPEPSRRSVAIAEREFHSFSGPLNDVALAIARSVNEAARTALRRNAPPHPAQTWPCWRSRSLSRWRCTPSLAAVRFSAGGFSFDSVSFGDLRVTSCPDGRDGCFDLEHTYPRLALIRMIDPPATRSCALLVIALQPGSETTLGSSTSSASLFDGPSHLGALEGVTD